MEAVTVDGLEEDNISEVPSALETDEPDVLIGCGEEEDPEKAVELLLADEEVAKLDVKLLVEENVELMPVEERNVEAVTVEPARLDCAVSDVTEVEVESPGLSEMSTLDDSTRLEAVVCVLELADIVVEVM